VLHGAPSRNEARGIVDRDGPRGAESRRFRGQCRPLVEPCFHAGAPWCHVTAARHALRTSWLSHYSRLARLIRFTGHAGDSDGVPSRHPAAVAPASAHVIRTRANLCGMRERGMQWS
jgi:hypothetical protein